MIVAFTRFIVIAEKALITDTLSKSVAAKAIVRQSSSELPVQLKLTCPQLKNFLKSYRYFKV